MSVHASDCAIYNEPAYPAGPCNCGLKGGEYSIGWQPIETAPKDGRSVIVFCPGEDGIAVCYWSTSIWVTPGAWICELNRSDTGRYEPSHWMPLPAPPNP